jgi:hypothetical protein
MLHRCVSESGIREKGENGVVNTPPKLGGVPSEARRGGSRAELLNRAASEPPRLLANARRHPS